MLRPEECHGRIRDVALEQFRAPVLPVFQERLKGAHLVACSEPQQHFGSRRRRTRPGVEQRQPHLSTRERLVEHGKVRDRDGEESESCSRFSDGQESGDAADWLEITQPQCKERRPAHIHVVEEREVGPQRTQVGSGRPVQSGEPRDQSEGPHTDETEERERTKDGEKPFAPALGAKQGGRPTPCEPRDAKVESRQSQTPAHRPRKDDSLEGVHKTIAMTATLDRRAKARTCPILSLGLSHSLHGASANVRHVGRARALTVTRRL